MPNVYVVNNAGYDYDKAQEHGELIYLTQGYINIHKDYDELVGKLKNLIKTANPENDFLLLSGNNLLCLLAFDIWKEIHKKVNILHWNPSFGARVYELYKR